MQLERINMTWKMLSLHGCFCELEKPPLGLVGGKGELINDFVSKQKQRNISHGIIITAPVM